MYSQSSFKEKRKKERKGKRGALIRRNAKKRVGEVSPNAFEKSFQGGESRSLIPTIIAL